MNNATVISAEEQRCLKEGYKHIENNEWDKAIEEFKNAMEVNPSNIWTHIELGKLYRTTTQLHLAEMQLKEALNMSPSAEQAEQAHIYLGVIYRMQGRHNLSMEEFKEALRINPDNKKIEMWIARINEVQAPRKEFPPYRVFFTWRINYECNYRCSYCNAPKPEKPFFDQEARNCAIYMNAERWIQIWDSIHKRYGSCRIRMDGGEPSIYPSFIELVQGISRIHFLQINTNLSFDVADFVKRVNVERVRIDASFHPEYMPLEDFLHKISILNEHKFKIVVSCVAYPPFLDRINEYKRPFENLHIPFIIHPFAGGFKEKNYPRDYAMEEITKIYSTDQASELIMNWRRVDNKTTKGKLCRMGQMYATIYPNGEVYRCCVQDKRLLLCNLAVSDLQLLDEPIPCECEDCPCWRSMIVTEEGRWASTWLDDWEMLS